MVEQLKSRWTLISPSRNHNRSDLGLSLQNQSGQQQSELSDDADFGRKYRRITVMLQREGWFTGKDRVQRLRRVKVLLVMA